MPQVRIRRQSPSRGVPVVLGSVVLAAAAGVVHWPPGPVLWAGLLVAAWTEPPAVLTGKRDSAGFPTPAGSVEVGALRRQGFWRSLRWRLLLPNLDWLPGRPPLASFVTAVCAAVLAGCFPVAWWPFAVCDAVAVFVVVCAVSAAVRRATGDGGAPCPGTRVTALGLLPRRPGLCAAAVVLGAVGSVTACCAVVLLAPATGDWAPTNRVVAMVAAAATGCCLGVSWPLSRVALADWRALTASAARWATRWAALRFDPAPALTGTEAVRVATVETFRAPDVLGSRAFLGLASRIAPSLGPGVRVAVLETPDTDPTGQPRPGTRHPLRFQVVTWPATDPPNPDGPTPGPAAAALLIRSAVFWTMEANGYGQPILETLDRITTDGPASEPDVPPRDTGRPVAPTALGADTSCAADAVEAVFDQPRRRSAIRRARRRGTFRRIVFRAFGGRSASSGRDLAEVGERSPVVWRSTWAAPQGPSLESIRPMAGEIARNAGCEVLIDHRQGHLFFGALTDLDTAWVDPTDADLMGRLETEDWWTHIWSQVLKQGANPPTVQHATATQVSLPGGGVVHRVGFVTRMGIDPADYRGLEPKLATALDAAPFVSVTGWPADPTSAGTRHPQAFAVCWATSAVPTGPDRLELQQPVAGWVLAGRVNAAFDAAHLARPEVVTARHLTATGSPGVIWEITVRLYGGVTLADVRSRAGRIRQSLDVPWLRVTPADTGCVLYAGARKEDARLADPGADRLRLEALDWDQAWADSGVTGRGGLLPDLVDTAPLPRNPAVRVLDFRLPAGVDPARVRRALPKLRTATGNDYLQTQPSAAGTLRMLVARDNPLPELAPFDFTAADHGGAIPFAVGVDGDVVSYDPAVDPHLLLAGLTGAGKSCLAQGLVYGALIRGWQVYLVDPVKGGADYHFARNHCHAVAATPTQAAAALRAVYTEITARKQRNAAHGVGSTRDLPDPPPHLLVVIDEFTSLVGRDPVPPRTDDPHLDAERDIVEAANHAKIEIGVYAGKIAREARSAGVTLALGTQKLSAKMLDTIPGAGDLKVNLSRVLLGKASWGDRASALRAPDDAPDLDGTIPGGRGLWETTAHPAHIIQTWYASQDEFRANLETRAPELPSAERLALRAEGPHVDACPGHGSKGQTADAIPSTLDLGDIDLSLTDLEAACAKDPAGVPLADRPDVFDDGFGPPGPRSRAATANQHQWDLDS